MKIGQANQRNQTEVLPATTTFKRKAALSEQTKKTNVSSLFYNNCLISRALIGSFLSSIRVQTDKILIYASFQVQLSAVKLSTF